MLHALSYECFTKPVRAQRSFLGRLLLIALLIKGIASLAPAESHSGEPLLGVTNTICNLPKLRIEHCRLQRT